MKRNPFVRLIYFGVITQSRIIGKIRKDPQTSYLESPFIRLRPSKRNLVWFTVVTRSGPNTQLPFFVLLVPEGFRELKGTLSSTRKEEETNEKPRTPNFYGP